MPPASDIFSNPCFALCGSGRKQHSLSLIFLFFLVFTSLRPLVSLRCSGLELSWWSHQRPALLIAAVAAGLSSGHHARLTEERREMAVPRSAANFCSYRTPVSLPQVGGERVSLVGGWHSVEGGPGGGHVGGHHPVGGQGTRPSCSRGGRGPGHAVVGPA